ncbi:MAG: NADH-quinone oxidoreductase subunit M [Pseudomonadota bacterium]
MGFINSHLLTAIIFLPIAGMIVVLAMPSKWTRGIRVFSLFTSLCVFALTALAFTRVSGTGEFEIVEQAPWIVSLGISYHLGIDGASLLLLLLTAVLVPISIIASWREIDRQVKAFHVLILLLETGMLGVFAALDVFLFYVFWEVVLIPMYFMIGIWGSGDRIRAALKFVIFTMVGSLLMLVAILYAANAANSFDLLAWYAHHFTAREQIWLFAALALAFAIKVPIIGFHTWLPDAHTEAPTAGSILLAGVLLKMGAYGFFRFAMPLFPLAVVEFMPAILTLSVVGIIAGALLAMVQPDLKRLIAYSSVSHMGFVMLGLAALNREAVAGSVLQMVNHGLTTGALFLMVGMIYGRRHTRMIADYGGTARSWPALAAVFIFMVLSSMGLPGLNNFAGEFLVLLGSFQTRTVFSAIAILGVILVAIYMLWAVARVFFGPLKNEEERRMPDLCAREYATLVPLIALIIMIGVWPEFLLTKIWRPAQVFVKLSKRVEMIVPASIPPREVFPSPLMGEGQGEGGNGKIVMKTEGSPSL